MVKASKIKNNTGLVGFFLVVSEYKFSGMVTLGCFTTKVV